MLHLPLGMASVTVAVHVARLTASGSTTVKLVGSTATFVGSSSATLQLDKWRHPLGVNEFMAGSSPRVCPARSRVV